MEQMNARNTVPEQLKLENQLCFPLYAAARAVVGKYGPHLKKLGLTYTQYIAMMVLWENDGIPVGELGEKLRLDSGTLTPLLKKLEKAGYITRSRSSEDERIVLISLTDEGRGLAGSAANIPQAVASCMPLTTEEAVTLYGLLYRIIDAV